MAVLLDATIVRSVLLPATMRLLGERNWWLPSFLRWLPEVTIEGEVDAPPDEVADESPSPDGARTGDPDGAPERAPERVPEGTAAPSPS